MHGSNPISKRKMLCVEPLSQKARHGGHIVWNIALEY